MAATKTIIVTTVPVPSDGDLEHRRLQVRADGARDPVHHGVVESCVAPARTRSAISEKAHVQNDRDGGAGEQEDAEHRVGVRSRTAR